jgi:hypothetical protein
MDKDEAIKLRDKLVNVEEINREECVKAIALFWQHGYVNLATEIRLMLEKEDTWQNHTS